MRKDIILSPPPPPHQPTQQNVLTFLKVWQVLILPRIEQSILPRWVDPAQKTRRLYCHISVLKGANNVHLSY